MNIPGLGLQQSPNQLGLTLLFLFPLAMPVLCFSRSAGKAASIKGIAGDIRADGAAVGRTLLGKMQPLLTWAAAERLAGLGQCRNV